MVAISQQAISRRSRPGLLTTAALILAAIVPALLGFSVLYHQFFAAPHTDDYHAILAFACDYQNTPGLANKILLIAATQHNEYKLFLEHFIIAVEMSLTHHVNFTFLVALGDLFLLPTAWLLWLTCRREGESLNSQLLRFLPISLVFFSLTYWETASWAMDALNRLPVIFFSFLAIYLLAAQPEERSTPVRVALACLAGALAAFSSANGFLLPPVGLFILLPRRAYAAAFAWLAAFAVPLAANFYHRGQYNPVSHSIGPMVWLARPLTFVSFLGSAVQNFWCAVPLGIAVLAVAWFAFRCRYDRTNPVACWFAVWIFINAALAGWVRGTAGIVFASRYSIFSDLLVILCYVFLLDHLSERSFAFNARRFQTIAVSAAVLFCVWSDFQANQELAALRRMVRGGIEHYRANPALNSPLIDPAVMQFSKDEESYEHTQLNHAIQLGIYTLPPMQ